MLCCCGGGLDPVGFDFITFPTLKLHGKTQTNAQYKSSNSQRKNGRVSVLIGHTASLLNNCITERNMITGN
jgi:hypothetical protein